MGCSVSGDTLQYRLEEGVSHRRTRHMTQLTVYLFMTQCRTAATPTSVCLLLRHDSARHPQLTVNNCRKLG